jgi:hypothetical protein
VETHDARRLKVWRALSDLFLDSEIDDATFDHIARTILETGYSPKEIHGILWGEVFPVLEGNLRSVAGVWAGWSEEWLIEHIKISTGSPAIQGEIEIIREIKRCWGLVASRLPAEYA